MNITSLTKLTWLKPSQDWIVKDLCEAGVELTEVLFLKIDSSTPI